MGENFKKDFSTAVAGYNRNEVDTYVAKLLQEALKLEQYNSMAIREQNSLRERIVELEESLKLAKSPGYAQVGAQFEQTLRLAESEAARLVNDAGRDAIKIREEAKVEAESLRFELQKELDSLRLENEKQSKSLLAAARKDAANLIDRAEKELAEAERQRADFEKQMSVLRSEADTYAANVKAELQIEVEKIQNANARLLKRNAELEAEIARKLDEGEKQALEIFRRVEKEAEEKREEAERLLAAATDEASGLVDNAQETLSAARLEADRIVNEANSVSLNLLADTRIRAERLAIKSLDLTREAISEAEYRLSKLPTQQNALEEFLKETENLLTPEQIVILARRKSIENSKNPDIEVEVLDSDSSI